MAVERFALALPAVSHPSSAASPSSRLVFPCLSEGSSFLPPSAVGIDASHCWGVRGGWDRWGETLAQMLPFPHGDGGTAAQRLPPEHPLMLPSSAYQARGTGQVTSVLPQVSRAIWSLPREEGPALAGSPGACPGICSSTSC